MSQDAKRVWKVGDVAIFTKSGNPVRVIEDHGDGMLTVTPLNKDKQMLVPTNALVCFDPSGEDEEH